MLKLLVVSISVSFFCALLAASAEEVEPSEPVAVRETERSGASPCRPPSSQTATIEQDVRCWRAIVNGTDPAEYEAYLKHFPSGVFRALAVSRLNALLAEAAPNPRREQAGCFYCSPSGTWRVEPTLVVPKGRFVEATDSADEGEIEGFPGNASLQLGGVDFAMRRPRWFKVGGNVGLGIGQHKDYGLFTASGSVFVQLRAYRFEYGYMYLRSANPDLDSTQRDRTVRFFGVAFPGLSDALMQLISR